MLMGWLLTRTFRVKGCALTLRFRVKVWASERGGVPNFNRESPIQLRFVKRRAISLMSEDASAPDRSGTADSSIHVAEQILCRGRSIVSLAREELNRYVVVGRASAA